jgi:hypothetical protein
MDMAQQSLRKDFKGTSSREENCFLSEWTHDTASREVQQGPQIATGIAQNEMVSFRNR